MRVEFKDRDDAWRGRGRPRRTDIPEQIRHMAEATYKTGNVAVVEIEPGEEEECLELRVLLNAYAKETGRRMRYQRQGCILRFEMIDENTPEEP